MTRLIVLPALILLAGCAGTAAPVVEYRTVEVTREVMRPCPVKAPARPDPIGPLPGSLEQLAAALGAKLKEYAAPGGYADRAEAAIRTCTATAP